MPALHRNAFGGARKRDPNLAGNDGLVATAPLAELYYHTFRQPRTAWTVEVEVRPWSEPG